MTPATSLTGILQHLRQVSSPDDASPSDGKLLEGFVLLHEQAAFEMLVRRHGPMVLGACLRVLGNRHDAEDAFQVTFLVLVRKARSLLRRETVGNWLYGVACHTAQKARAAALKRHVKERQAAAVSVEWDDDPWEEWRPLLDQELGRLPEKYRAPVVLCDLEGKTQKEAARQLGCPEGTVSGRLFRARALLARRLSGRGPRLSGAALATALAQTGAASASLPPALVASTVTAAQGAAAGAVSARVALLAGQALKAMPRATLKVVAGAGVALALLVAGLLARGPGGAERPSGDPAPRQGGPAPVPQAAPARPEPVRAGQPTRPRATFAAHLAEVHSVAYSPDGKVLASVGRVDPDRKWAICLRDARTGQELKVIPVWDTPICFTPVICFSPDSKSIAATGGEKTAAEVWDVATGEKRLSIKYPKKRPSDWAEGMWWIAYSPDGKTLATAAGLTGAIHFFDAKTGEPVGGVGAGTKFAYSPDSKLLAGRRQAPLFHVWDVATRKDRGPFKSHLSVVVALAFSPDSKTLAVGGVSRTDGNNPIHLWDVVAGKELEPLRGHTSTVFALAYCPGTRVLTSASRDNTIRFWDTTTNKQVAVLGYRADAIAFSPDGNTLATGGADGTVRLWDVPGTRNDARIDAIVKATAAVLPPEVTPVVPTSRDKGQDWRYTFTRPAAHWFKPDFNDLSWKIGPGGFGNKGTPGGVDRTPWHTSEIWLRREIVLPDRPFTRLLLQVHADDYADVYLNGVLAARVTRCTPGYLEVAISKEARKTLRAGPNVLAVTCRDTGGGRYIDVGLVEPKR